MLISHIRQTLKDHERVRARIEALKGLRRGEVNLVLQHERVLRAL